MRVERLKCRVTVKTGSKASPLHAAERAPRPALHFALPAPQPRTEVSVPEPSLTATQEKDASGGAGPEIQRADPRAVANRVYDLMRQELMLARQRGLGGRKG